MTKALVLLILTMCFGCSAPKKTSSLPGNYVAWMFSMGQAESLDGTGGTSQKLILKPDGSYEFETSTSVMMKLSMKAIGTYTHEGNQVNLRGTMTSEMDDGYQKSNDTGPHKLDLKAVDQMLVWTVTKDQVIYFRKEGTGPPPLPPQLKLKDSEPIATALIQNLKKIYASLKSFRATGTLESKAGGFVAERSTFKILYQSPTKVRFEASILDGDKEFDRTEITWEGGENCWWYTKEFGETTEIPINNALGIAVVKFGPEFDILPSLLLPNELGESGTLSDNETTLLTDEMVRGKLCKVVQLKDKDAVISKLWIDQSTGMILRFYEGIRKVTVTIDPQPNATIDSKEFMLGKRSKPGTI